MAELCDGTYASAMGQEQHLRDIAAPTRRFTNSHFRMVDNGINGLRLLLICVGALFLLGSCEERPTNVVIDACIGDGQPLKFCECTSRNMDETLGADNYAVFSDIIKLGESQAPQTHEIIRIMEKHGLAPELLASIMRSIELAIIKVQAICSP